MGHDWECECSEDYGPCENHMDVIAQREGASTRTTDDLVYVFLTDVLAAARDKDIRRESGKRMGRTITDNAPDVRQLVDAVNYWENDDLWNDNYGCRWVRDDVDAEIHDGMSTGENVLADLGLSVQWDDGYVIYRIHDDCPLIAD